jgi:vacuolar-type H+-ATPase subunit I/STV1
MDIFFEIFFTIGNLMVFLSSFFLIKNVWKERKKIKEYNPIGSILTFLGILMFCFGYFHVGLYIPLLLAMPTTVFWFIVSIFCIKRLWKGD